LVESVKQSVFLVPLVIYENGLFQHNFHTVFEQMYGVRDYAMGKEVRL